MGVRIKNTEKLFLILNACLSGLGTAAGFAFPSLTFLAALLNVTGAALLFLSIGGIVVFGILALLVGFYFFYTVFKTTQETIKTLEDTQERMLDVLINYASYPNKNEINSFIPINTHIQSIIDDVRDILNSNKCGINTTTTIKEILRKNERLKRNLKLHKQSLIQQFKNKSSFFLDSPTLHGSVNSFIGYGSILGPCAGIIGTISGVGMIGGITAIAPPVLISVICVTVALAFLAAYLTYYADSRNAERSFIINEYDELIGSFNDSIKTTLLCSYYSNRIDITPDKKSTQVEQERRFKSTMSIATLTLNPE